MLASQRRAWFYERHAVVTNEHQLLPLPVFRALAWRQHKKDILTAE